MITLSKSCTKDKKNKLIGEVKILKGKKLEYIVFISQDIDDLKDAIN